MKKVFFALKDWQYEFFWYNKWSFFFEQNKSLHKTVIELSKLNNLDFLLLSFLKKDNNGVLTYLNYTTSSFYNSFLFFNLGKHFYKSDEIVLNNVLNFEKKFYFKFYQLLDLKNLKHGYSTKISNHELRNFRNQNITNYKHWFGIIYKRSFNFLFYFLPYFFYSLFEVFVISYIGLCLFFSSMPDYFQDTNFFKFLKYVILKLFGDYFVSIYFIDNYLMFLNCFDKKFQFFISIFLFLSLIFWFFYFIFPVVRDYFFLGISNYFKKGLLFNNYMGTSKLSPLEGRYGSAKTTLWSNNQINKYQMHKTKGNEYIVFLNPLYFLYVGFSFIFYGFFFYFLLELYYFVFFESNIYIYFYKFIHNYIYSFDLIKLDFFKNEKLSILFFYYIPSIIFLFLILYNVPKYFDYQAFTFGVRKHESIFSSLKNYLFKKNNILSFFKLFFLSFSKYKLDLNLLSKNNPYANDVTDNGISILYVLLKIIFIFFKCLLIFFLSCFSSIVFFYFFPDLKNIFIILFSYLENLKFFYFKVNDIIIFNNVQTLFSKLNIFIFVKYIFEFVFDSCLWSFNFLYFYFLFVFDIISYIISYIYVKMCLVNFVIDIKVNKLILFILTFLYCLIKIWIYIFLIYIYNNCYNFFNELTQNSKFVDYLSYKENFSVFENLNIFNFFKQNKLIFLNYLIEFSIIFIIFYILIFLIFIFSFRTDEVFLKLWYEFKKQQDDSKQKLKLLTLEQIDVHEKVNKLLLKQKEIEKVSKLFGLKNRFFLSLIENFFKDHKKQLDILILFDYFFKNKYSYYFYLLNKHIVYSIFFKLKMLVFLTKHYFIYNYKHYFFFNFNKNLVFIQKNNVEIMMKELEKLKSIYGKDSDLFSKDDHKMPLFIFFNQEYILILIILLEIYDSKNKN